MIFEKAILEIYPNAVPNVDFVIGADPETHEQFFIYWNHEKFLQPTIEEMESVLLAAMRKKKLIELTEACNKTILGRFRAVVEGVEYLFSHDAEAQMNFEIADKAFDKNRITEVGWTAYTLDGELVRLLLTQETFEPVYMKHLEHIQSNIVKLRDYLQPIVETATLEELETISWS